MADNKVRYGIQNVYVAFIKEDGTYDTPVAIPGARNLTTDPQGESTNWYADNIPYVTFNSNAGYTGTLEMAYFPDTVLAQMLGWTIDANGAIVEDADAIGKSFALLYEVKGDAKNRRNAFYNVSAARPSSNAQTQEASIDPQTESLTITMIPKKFTEDNVSRNLTKASMEPSETNTTAYNAWFTEVYIPDFTESGESGVTGA